MKENEWINPREVLPKIGQLVEVKFHASVGDSVENSKFDINDNGYIGFLNPRKIMYDFHQIMGWRHIPEKRPDFSRLIYLDKIVVKYEVDGETSETIGFFSRVYGSQCQFLEVLSDKVMDCAVIDECPLSRITKITRINLEEKKFEEI